MAGITGREPHLTGRQREILERIARGKTNVQIADELGIGFETVKMHVSHTLAELGVSSREEAAEWWRASRRPLARMRALIPGLSLAKLIAGGAAVVAVGAAGVVAVALASFGGSPDVSAGVAPTSTPGPGIECQPSNGGAVCRTVTVAPPTFTVTPNILSVQPTDGSTVDAASLIPPDANTLVGVCAGVILDDLQENLRQFRLEVDGVDVTTQLVISARSDASGPATLCYGPKEGLSVGHHSATLRVFDSGFPGARAIQNATWSFTVTPSARTVEPDASYPIPLACNSDLFAAVFNRFFAAFNRGDALTMFDLVNDPRGVWFDLGYDPLTFVSTGGRSLAELRTLDDFKALVARYAGMHWTFYGEPSGSLVAGAPNVPEAIDGNPTWRLTGPALTGIGKIAAFGSGKFGAYCDTHKLFGVMAGPTVQ